MKRIEVGDKVRIVEFHVERMVGRKGTVTKLRVGPSRKMIKATIPGFTNSLGTQDWYFLEDELERI